MTPVGQYTNRGSLGVILPNALWIIKIHKLGFSTTVHQVWFNQLMIFANFILTTICYPALITAIPCRQMQSLASAEWFQTLLLTIFTLFERWQI
jgi:hypothetical protein